MILRCYVQGCNTYRRAVSSCLHSRSKRNDRLVQERSGNVQSNILRGNLPYTLQYNELDRDETVVTITELRIELFRVRIPLEGHDFSHPSRRVVGSICTVGTGSYPLVKRSGNGVDLPLQQASRLKEE